MSSNSTVKSLACSILLSLFAVNLFAQDQTEIEWPSAKLFLDIPVEQPQQELAPAGQRRPDSDEVAALEKQLEISEAEAIKAKQSHDEFQNDNPMLELNYQSQVERQRAISGDLRARQSEVAQLAAHIERLKIAADSGDASAIEEALWMLDQQGVIAEAARGGEANNQELEQAQRPVDELIVELALLQNQFGADHPKVKVLKDRLAVLEKSILKMQGEPAEEAAPQDRLSQVKAQLAAKLEEEREQIQTENAKLARLTEGLPVLRKKREELLILAIEVQHRKKIHQLIVERLKALGVTAPEAQGQRDTRVADGVAEITEKFRDFSLVEFAKSDELLADLVGEYQNAFEGDLESTVAILKERLVITRDTKNAAIYRIKVQLGPTPFANFLLKEWIAKIEESLAEFSKTEGEKALPTLREEGEALFAQHQAALEAYQAKRREVDPSVALDKNSEQARELLELQNEIDQLEKSWNEIVETITKYAALGNFEVRRVSVLDHSKAIASKEEREAYEALRERCPNLPTIDR